MDHSTNNVQYDRKDQYDRKGYPPHHKKDSFNNHGNIFGFIVGIIIIIIIICFIGWAVYASSDVGCGGKGGKWGGDGY